MAVARSVVSHLLTTEASPHFSHFRGCLPFQPRIITNSVRHLACAVHDFVVNRPSLSVTRLTSTLASPHHYGVLTPYHDPHHPLVRDPLSSCTIRTKPPPTTTATICAGTVQSHTDLGGPLTQWSTTSKSNPVQWTIHWTYIRTRAGPNSAFPRAEQPSE